MATSDRIMTDPRAPHRVPLLPLSDFVHFPRTRIRLHVHEPRYRRLVRDLMERQEEERQLGVVLVKPGGQRQGLGRREIFPGGTVARITGSELLPDGRSNLALEGQYRFLLRREVGREPYREALVERVAEPSYDDDDAGIQAVRGQILDAARLLALELAESFPLDDEALQTLDRQPTFEEVVNVIAAELDLPALRKLQLLVASLPDRALDVLSILRARKQMMDLLRPFRPLAEKAQHN